MRKPSLSLLLAGAVAVPAIALAGGLRPMLFGTAGPMRLVQPAALQAIPTLAIPPHAVTPGAAMMPISRLSVTPVAIARPPGLMLARMTEMAQGLQAMQLQIDQQLLQLSRLMAVPDAAVFAPQAIPADAPMLRVSMTSIAAPGGVCSEIITARPGPHGTMQVEISHHGAGCGHAAGMTAMPHGAPPAPSPGVTVQGRHVLPSDRLPPPAKTTFAKYVAPPAHPNPVRG